MRKIRLYFDTSAIGMIDNDHSPRWQAAAKRMFENINENADDYELFISKITKDEIEQCNPKTRAVIEQLLGAFRFTELPDSAEAAQLAEHYMKGNILSQKHLADLTHIAYATVARCDAVISCNFKHFLNPKIFYRLKRLNDELNLTTPPIWSPLVFEGKTYNE
ncbi:MAG: hypothetical protein LBT46_12600 [Planctomycetaceae bacterium]|nr:hypothetical protein [Planctomycetaceae bacterium]